MRTIMLALGLLLTAIPVFAAEAFRQVTLDQFVQQWNIAADREAKDLGIDPIHRILAQEKREDRTQLKLKNEKLIIMVTVQQGKVARFNVMHAYKGDMNILGFRSVADLALEAFTPFWKPAQRERFMEEKMRQKEWIQRRADVVVGKEAKWSATYYCTPHHSSMVESFSASINNMQW